MAEYAGNRRDSMLAREVRVALPRELTLVEQIILLRRYVTADFVEQGMIADIAIHDKKDGNPHAHILLSVRDVTEKGFGDKNREWDDFKNANIWRREWANILNREFKRKGLEIRVSHESYAARGIKRKPTLHLGYKVKEFERQGIETDRSNINRDIIRENQERAAKNKRLQELELQWELEQSYDRER
jgi:hypothetical protein